MALVSLALLAVSAAWKGPVGSVEACVIVWVALSIISAPAFGKLHHSMRSGSCDLYVLRDMDPEALRGPVRSALGRAGIPVRRERDDRFFRFLGSPSERWRCGQRVGARFFLKGPTPESEPTMLLLRLRWRWGARPDLVRAAKGEVLSALRPLFPPLPPEGAVAALTVAKGEPLD